MTNLTSLRSWAPMLSLLIGAVGLGAIEEATLAPPESTALCPAGTAVVARGELFLGRAIRQKFVIEISGLEPLRRFAGE